jgi:hypothetical protein
MIAWFTYDTIKGYFVSPIVCYSLCEHTLSTPYCVIHVIHTYSLPRHAIMLLRSVFPRTPPGTVPFHGHPPGGTHIQPNTLCMEVPRFTLFIRTHHHCPSTISSIILTACKRHCPTAGTRGSGLHPHAVNNGFFTVVRHIRIVVLSVAPPLPSTL